MDKAVGDIRPIERPNPLMARDVTDNKHPMIPNLVNLSDEERRRFQDSVGAMYLGNLINFTVRIFDAISQGEFLDAINTADMIWVAYPDLIPFLDREYPSKILYRREQDYVNYKWSKYAGVDDAVMVAADRRYQVPDDKYAELLSIRERAIQREYLMFEFLQKVHFGMRDLGWLLQEETRLNLPWTKTSEEPEPESEPAADDTDTTDG